jgi:hypothetical protein
MLSTAAAIGSCRPLSASALHHELPDPERARDLSSDDAYALRIGGRRVLSSLWALFHIQTPACGRSFRHRSSARTSSHQLAPARTSSHQLAPARTSSHRALPTAGGTEPRTPPPPGRPGSPGRTPRIAGVLPVTRMLVSLTGTRYTRVLSALSAPAPSPDAEARPPIRALRALCAGQSPARSDQRQRPLRPQSRFGSTL